MYRTDGVLGGSIWSGIDDIFQLPDGNAVGYGAWGVIDGWRRMKPEYWDMKKIFSPVKILTKSLEPACSFVIEAENRFTFTNFSELSLEWTLGKESGRTQVQLQPGQRGQFRIDVKNPNAGSQLYLRFKDPRGVVVDEYLIPVGEQMQNRIPDLVCQKTRLQTKKDMFIVQGKDFTCEVSRTDGQIKRLISHGKSILEGGPWLMALPLTGGGCLPNHNANTPVFNDCCKGWKTDEVTAEKNENGVLVSVKGNYEGFSGSYQMQINANGQILINYKFTASVGLNPRQWGMVFASADGFDETFWRREGLWSVYPADHISRPVGRALSFYSDVPRDATPRTEPTWSWSKDYSEIGSNDFRSTRRNIWLAGLDDQVGKGQILIVSNGHQHWRCWKEGKKTHFLIADFVTAGDEGFLGAHYAPYRKPIKAGDVISGSIELRIK